MPVVAATELVSAGRCSEMDIVLDLWLSTVYNDEQVQGSKAGPVVYLRNGTSSPLVNYSEASCSLGYFQSYSGKNPEKACRNGIHIPYDFSWPDRQRDLSAKLSVHHVSNIGCSD